MILGTGKSQEDVKPIPEAEIEEWVIGELCGHHAMVPYSSYLEQLRDQRQ